MKNAITLLFFFIYLNSQCQNLSESEPYNSDFEKNIFNKIEHGEDYKYRELYSAIDYENKTYDTTINLIEKTKQDLDSKKIASKKIKKQIKEIVKYVSFHFLKTEKKDATFKDIIVYKNYNSTSASLLYSILFDYYKIPYTINEINTHQFLTVFSEGKEIIIQPNKNLKTIQSYNSDFKTNFVKYIKENSLLATDFDKNNSDEEIFSKHYQNKNIITKTQLASLQYYNKALSLANTNQLKEALPYAEKAFLLSKDGKTTFYYNLVLANVINLDFDRKKYNPVLFAKFLNLNPESETEKNNIKNMLSMISNNYLIQNQDLKSYTSFFNSFKNNFNKKDIDFSSFQEIYHLELSNFHYYKREYDKTVYHLSEALIINPKNLASQNNLESSINALMSVSTKDDEIIEKYNDYFDRFPFLKQNDYHQLNYTRVFLKKIYESYLSNNIKEGELNIQKFKNILLQYPNIKYDENLITTAFVTAASKYNYKNYNKSIKLIKTGLKLAPNSKILSSALTEIKGTNQNKISFNDDYETLNKTFTEKIIAYFKKCWSVTNIKKIGKDINKEDEILEFSIELDSTKYQTLYFNINNKKIECEWSIRYNSQLLYIIPKNNRSNYFVYKINDLSESELILRPFVKNKLTNRILTLTKCK